MRLAGGVGSEILSEMLSEILSVIDGNTYLMDNGINSFFSAIIIVFTLPFLIHLVEMVFGPPPLDTTT